MCAARVSFYVLSGTEAGARLSYACRLVEKAYKLQNRIHAHAGSASMAKVLDTLLWTFRQGSFVPHEILTPDTLPTAPITIGGEGNTAPPDADLLVNLADEVPGFFGRYARIAEIIDGSPACREAGRARHRFYREQGLEPETHEVS
ncbi:MAG: DNA polymerase III subunit chi [Gammaproteobacteria bacterium]|nr:DNA polymerase III subunit chi [Gammaproteobacteria bacterium]